MVSVCRTVTCLFVLIFLSNPVSASRGITVKTERNWDGCVTGTEPGMCLRDEVIYHNPAQPTGYDKTRDPDLDEEDFVFQVASLGSGVPASGASALSAVPLPGYIWKEPVTGMEFVWVPGGCFQMGQTTAEKESLTRKIGEEKYKNYCLNELPRHRVCLDGFWMGKREVTRGQFRAFVRGTGYRTDAEKQGKAWVKNEETEWNWEEIEGYDWNNVGYAQDDTHPVACVSWNDANAFAEWLSKMSGRKIRLPTEAQWEYAARGGTGAMRFWGNDDSDACVYANVADKGHDWIDNFPCDDGYAFTAPVGSYRPNHFGLYDMLGNVREWCADRYGEDYYKHSPRVDPKGPASGSFRVKRGGSWNNNARNCRCANRRSHPPAFNRCVA